MKIVLIDSVSDLYGSSRICKLILEMLRDAGHEVLPFVRVEHRVESERYAMRIDYPLLVMSRLKADPIKYIRNLLMDFFNFWHLSKDIFKGADIVYCNTLGTLPVCVIARLRGKSVVLHVHESIELPSGLRWLTVKIISAVSTQIIFVSEATANAWGLLNYPKACIAHNGISDYPSMEDVHRVSSSIRRYHFAFIGRLTKKKGIFLFMDALHLLDEECVRQGKCFSVAIVGGVLPGQILPFNKGQLNQFKSLDVDYLGEVDDPSGVYLDTKIVCVPSVYADPYPTVVLEGLRAGCSVVASNIGGAKEALHGSVSSLFISGDPMALKNAMLEQLLIWETLPPNKRNRDTFLHNHTIGVFKKRLLPHIEQPFGESLHDL